MRFESHRTSRWHRAIRATKVAIVRAWYTLVYGPNGKTGKKWEKRGKNGRQIQKNGELGQFSSFSQFFGDFFFFGVFRPFFSAFVPFFSHFCRSARFPMCARPARLQHQGSGLRSFCGGVFPTERKVEQLADI